jgi:hypothetical protein
MAPSNIFSHRSKQTMRYQAVVSLRRQLIDEFSHFNIEIQSFIESRMFIESLSHCFFIKY